MDEHLSDFALDELVTARGQRPASEHLQHCSECRERLASFERQQLEARSAPEFEQVFARLRAGIEASREKPRRLWLWSLMPALSAAAVAFVYLYAHEGRPPAEDRIKGTPTLSLLRLDGSPVGDAPLTVGERVVLAAGSAGMRYLLVMGADDTEVSSVWPVHATESGSAPPSAEGLLNPPFTVTPGEVTLYAFFSAEPLTTEAAKTMIEKGRALGGHLESLPGQTIISRRIKVARVGP